MGQWFKPQTCKKSEQLDKVAAEKFSALTQKDFESQSRELSKDRRTQASALVRPLMMMEKRAITNHKVEQMKKIKESQETEGCTFAPETNKKLIKELRDKPIANRYAQRNGDENIND